MGTCLKHKSKQTGLFFVLPFIDKYEIIDLRSITFEIAAYEILTTDFVTVSVEATICYRVVNPFQTVEKLNNSHFKEVYLLTETILSSIISGNSLEKITKDRISLSKKMKVL